MKGQAGCARAESFCQNELGLSDAPASLTTEARSQYIEVEDQTLT